MGNKSKNRTGKQWAHARVWMGKMPKAISPLSTFINEGHSTKRKYSVRQPLTIWWASSTQDTFRRAKEA
jgi:hypothetical protein